MSLNGDQDLVAQAARDAGRIGDRLRKIARPPGREAHQRVVAHAVIAALEFEDLVAFPERSSGAHRVEVRLGPGADKAHLLGAGHGGHDGLGQLDPEPVVGKEGRARRDARLGGSSDLGMGVTDQHRSGAQQEIDILPSALVPYPTAAAFADHHIGREIAEAAAGENAFGLLDQSEFDIPFRTRVHDTVSSLARVPSGTMWRSRDRKIVVRFIRRRAEGSNGSRRCIVKPLSHSTASPACQ